MISTLERDDAPAATEAHVQAISTRPKFTPMARQPQDGSAT
jgi:hypothetical protein